MLVFRTSNQTLFHREKRPENDDELLSVLQYHVGGFIEPVVHRQDDDDAPFTAYVNETGRITNLPPNDLAYAVLRQLGFRENDEHFYYGNVVLLGCEEQPVTEEQIKQVVKIVNKVVERTNKI